MRKAGKKDQIHLREEIFQLRLKIFESPMNKLFSLQSIQKGAQHQISIEDISIQDLKSYIHNLHVLIMKLSQYNEGHNQRENELIYDVRTAMKLAQIMRVNLMLPLSAKEFTQIEAMEYRALLNIYMQNQTHLQHNSLQKDSYYLTITQIQLYNIKLQDRVRQLHQRKTQLYTIQKLNQTISFLQSENNHLRKIVNYLSLKQLNDSQQLHINKQRQQLLFKKQQIGKLIQENKKLKEEMNIYAEGDRRTEEQVKLIKQNFIGYFTNKKKNYFSERGGVK